MIDSVCEWKLATVLVLGTLLLGLANSPAATDLEAARVKEIAAELPLKPAGFGRPVTDRAAWAQLARNPAFASVVSEAGERSHKPVPALTDELYQDYSKTGNRTGCERVLGERSKRVVSFTVAECLENRGRFVRPLTETITAICAEKTRTYPAHDRRLDNFEGRATEIDLRASAVAWELAMADYLLGDRLPPETRRGIRENVQRRVLQPFRDMLQGRGGDADDNAGYPSGSVVRKVFGYDDETGFA